MCAAIVQPNELIIQLVKSADVTKKPAPLTYLPGLVPNSPAGWRCLDLGGAPNKKISFMLDHAFHIFFACYFFMLNRLWILSFVTKNACQFHLLFIDGCPHFYSVFIHNAGHPSVWRATIQVGGGAGFISVGGPWPWHWVRIIGIHSKWREGKYLEKSFK